MSAVYQPRRPRASPLWQLVHHGWDDFLAEYEEQHRKSLGPLPSSAVATVQSFLRPEQVEFPLRLQGLWEGVIQLPRPPPPPFDVQTMESIDPPWQAIKEWIPDDDPDLNWFNPLSPPSAPVQMRLQSPPAKSKFLQPARAIELDPKITVAHLNRGAILTRNPATLRAGMTSLKEAIRLNPNLAGSNYHLGMALERSRNFQQAYLNYQKAAQLAPDHCGNAMQLAHLLERTGNLEQALNYYQNIARIHPKNPQAPFQMGLVSGKLEQFDKAISNYRDALTLNPNYLPALNNLAFLLATKPEHLDPEKAVALAQRAAELTVHKQAPVLDTLASAYLAAGDRTKTRTTLEKALRQAVANKQTALAAELKSKLAKLD